MGFRMEDSFQLWPHSSFILHEPQYQDYNIIILIIWMRMIIVPPSTLTEHTILCQLFSKHNIFTLSKPLLTKTSGHFTVTLQMKRHYHWVWVICSRHTTSKQWSRNQMQVFPSPNSLSTSQKVTGLKKSELESFPGIASS